MPLKNGPCKVSGNRTTMIAKLVHFLVALLKLSLEQSFAHFDLHDAVHILFLGVVGVGLRLLHVECRAWPSKTVRSSLKSIAIPGKKRGSVSFAAGTKFPTFHNYSPVGVSTFVTLGESKNITNNTSSGDSFTSIRLNSHFTFSHYCNW